MEVIEAMEVSEVAADALATAAAAVCVGGGRLTQAPEATVAQTVCPLPMLLSLSVEADGYR